MRSTNDRLPNEPSGLRSHALLIVVLFFLATGIAQYGWWFFCLVRTVSRTG